MKTQYQVSKSSLDILSEYETVPMYVDVTKKLTPIQMNYGFGGIKLFEEIVIPQYRKSYDDYADKPTSWKQRWDLSNWGFYIVEMEKKIIGGAIVAYRTKNVDMLEGRDDIAVLWDIRVHPEYKREGIGSRLFEEVIRFSRERDCHFLKIETQNVNVPACRF